MTELTGETEATLQRIEEQTEAILECLKEIKVGVDRLIQAIVGEDGDEAMAARAALREDRLRKRQATLACRDANRSIEDAALKPAQAKMVERWKFRAAVAIAIFCILVTIATALVK